MTRAAAGNSKINIYFNDRVLEALRKLARLQGTTYSELIRRASEEFVVKNAGKIMDTAKAVRELGR